MSGEAPLRAAPPPSGERVRSRTGVRLKLDAPAVLHLDPPSFAAEQYRSLAVQLEGRIALSGLSSFVLAVTSAEEKAGKTLTALNSALTLARGGERRVLLVEADLWRPGLRGYFEGDWPGQRGMMQVLDGTLTLSQATMRIEEAGLDLLSAGASGRVGDVLSGRRFAEFLREVRERYDVIVIDTPPLPLLAAARAIAARADGVVFVVRASQSRRAGIEHALNALGPDKVIGIVFNAARIRGGSYY